ncbi:hypothetical protein BDP27DRAFT_1433180 [Rhodocollybia butyracea]|uniref:Uncharacterized protein n=1 Tax=Rhodocollybia butyracea TaxID=206335 RepID=A0A9P5P9J3_9AGAR|nr:hypothetical protein BDP27DRAFT_1433180 [Rhodocollybia butyracea]
MTGATADTEDAFLDTGRKTKRNALPPFCLSSVPVVPVPADTPATPPSPRAGPPSSLTPPPGGAVLLRGPGDDQQSEEPKPKNAQPLTEKEMEAKEKELKAERGNRSKRTPSGPGDKRLRTRKIYVMRLLTDFGEGSTERFRAADDHLYKHRLHKAKDRLHVAEEHLQHVEHEGEFDHETLALASSGTDHHAAPPVLESIVKHEEVPVAFEIPIAARG